MYWTLEEQAEHRRLWVEALRSGKYEQGKRALRVHDEYCCLGVACDLFGKESGVECRHGAEGVYLYNTEVETLPVEMVRYLGLASKVGVMERGTLASHNDRGHPFVELADWISDGKVHLFLGNEVYLERYRRLRDYVVKSGGEQVFAIQAGFRDVSGCKNDPESYAYFAVHYYRAKVFYTLPWINDIIKELEGLCTGR